MTRSLANLQVLKAPREGVIEAVRENQEVQ
jgi:hypothetical protein